MSYSSAPPSLPDLNLPPDKNRGWQYVTVQWVSVSIATVLVITRVSIRRTLFKKTKWDDWTILLALVILQPLLN